MAAPDPYDDAFKADTNGPVVVVSGVGGVAVSMTPEAVLASLDPLRIAAERALENRRGGVSVAPEI